MKTIHRSKLTENFTSLPNKLLRGKHLSFAAKGVLAMMLSHSADWELDMKDLAEFGFEGRERIRRVVRELESAGHATRKTLKSNNGQFKGVVWTWYDKPVPVSQRTASPSDGFPSDGFPSQIRRLLPKTKSRAFTPQGPSSGDILFGGLLNPDQEEG